MYMVKSRLVSLTCIVNGAILTAILLLNICKINDRTFPSLLSLVMYFGAVIFNILVVLYADRKLQPILKTLKYYLFKNLRSVSKVIERISSELHNLQIGTLSLYEEICIRSYKVVTRTLVQDLANESSEVRSIPKVQTISTNEDTFQEYKTPDLKSLVDQKLALKSASDPVKKPVKLQITRRSLRVQSPELFKNKIYKSRMDLADRIEEERLKLRSKCRESTSSSLIE